MNVYETCPSFENEKYQIRLIQNEDAKSLLKVYSDVKAVPFFNSDNCNGDNFYYETYERMEQAVAFWVDAYKNGWFVRWTVVDKAAGEPVGTIEEFYREADDYFTNCGLLRLDLRSDYEKSEEIENILSLIATPSFDMFGCDKVAVKAISDDKERVKALQNAGFVSTDEKLIGHDGTQYGEYFVLKK